MTTPNHRNIPVARVAPQQSDSWEDDLDPDAPPHSGFHSAGICLMVLGSVFALLALYVLIQASSISIGALAVLLFGQGGTGLFLAGALFLVAGALLRGGRHD